MGYDGISLVTYIYIFIYSFIYLFIHLSIYLVIYSFIIIDRYIPHETSSNVKNSVHLKGMTRENMQHFAAGRSGALAALRKSTDRIPLLSRGECV